MLMLYTDLVNSLREMEAVHFDGPIPINQDTLWDIVVRYNVELGKVTGIWRGIDYVDDLKATSLRSYISRGTITSGCVYMYGAQYKPDRLQALSDEYHKTRCKIPTPAGGLDMMHANVYQWRDYTKHWVAVDNNTMEIIVRQPSAKALADVVDYSIDTIRNNRSKCKICTIVYEGTTHEALFMPYTEYCMYLTLYNSAPWR